MTRVEFSKILSNYRKEHGPSIKELCFQLNCMPTDIYRVEKGIHNYNIQKCMSYLHAIGLQLSLATKRSVTVIRSSEDFSKWLKKARANISQRTLANQVGVVYPTIANIERGSTIVSIDTFLKILEVLNCKPNIESI